MTGRLCLLCCENFRPEIEAVIAAEAWSDVVTAAFPSRCGLPPLSWDELRPLVKSDCSLVLILGRACLRELSAPPENWPPVRLLTQEECFHLAAGKTLVDEAIARNAYLITPGWLNDWRGNLRRMGFVDGKTTGFFRDFARELLLLDTGVIPDAPAKLAEMAEAVGLPATRIGVGIDYTRLLLGRLVCEWRQEELRRHAQARERTYARDIADQLSAMDFLGRLATLMEEGETIAAIEELFRMLFAPKDLHYVRFEDGSAAGLDALSPDLAAQLLALDRSWAWTASRTGFLLRISRGGKTVGVVVADRFAFPEFRERYLGLALSVADVCGLAIENARTFQRTKEAEEALRRSEQSLKMAQAIGHLGHWEWDMDTGAMQWSDETFRILGYRPQALLPSHDSFFLAIHPDDRAKVADQIAQARADGGFDIEYRIILPDGTVRVVHGMGEVIRLDGEGAPKMVGTIRDVAPRPPTEVLGVIQDITERKALELKLAQEAHTDALTGCANRRHFLELARQELARIRRYGGDLSLLMLDLDHFKAVNDRHGHAVGDMALQKVIQTCRAILREEDVIGRLGGEEFAVLLPHTAFAEAREAAERIRLAVADAELPLEDEPPLRVTISIGVTSAEPDEPGVETLLGRADQALYEAKHAGRNTVRPEKDPR